jgi:hypothetical protein
MSGKKIAYKAERAGKYLAKLRPLGGFEEVLALRREGRPGAVVCALSYLRQPRL